MEPMQKAATKAWREQVMEEHRMLHRMVADLRAFLQQPRPELGAEGAHTWASNLSRQLADLHDLLVRHFRFEEKGGMMEELVVSHPRATGQVNGLLDEHKQMLAESRAIMTAVLAYSEGTAESNARLRRRLTALLDRLGEHDQAETNLIMDLTCDDIGVGD